MGEPIKTQKDLLKERIPYDSAIFGSEEKYNKLLDRLLDDSKFIGLSLRYPYRNYSQLELPKKYENWQLRVCEELYSLMGNSNVKSYSENGLSWTRDSAYLNTSLVGEIEPLASPITNGDD